MLNLAYSIPTVPKSFLEESSPTEEKKKETWLSRLLKNLYTNRTIDNAKRNKKNFYFIKRVQSDLDDQLEWVLPSY